MHYFTILDGNRFRIDGEIVCYIFTELLIVINGASPASKISMFKQLRSMFGQFIFCKEVLGTSDPRGGGGRRGHENPLEVLFLKSIKKIMHIIII